MDLHGIGGDRLREADREEAEGLRIHGAPVIRRVDLHDEVIRALQTLPMGMRTVVVLHYLHDMGDQQIAGMDRQQPG